MPTWLIVVIVVVVLVIIGNLIMHAEKREKETIVGRTERLLAGNAPPQKVADWYFRVRERANYGEAGEVAMRLIMESDAPTAEEARGVIEARLEPIEARELWLEENYGFLRMPLVGWGISSFRTPLVCCHCGRDLEEGRCRERKISETFNLPISAALTKLSISFPYCLARCDPDPDAGHDRPRIGMAWVEDGGSDAIEVLPLHVRFVHAFETLNPRFQPGG